MSELESLEKLRRDDFHPGYHGEPTLEMIADEIQVEVDERYMKLPLDADGVPIHMGDTVEGELFFDNATVKGTVTTYHIHDNDEPDTVYIKVDRGGGTWTIKELQIKRCRHIKPRTLEDVLQDLEGLRGNGAMYEDVVCRAAELADEIRELLGADA